MNKDKNLLPWILVIGVLVVLIGAAGGVVLTIQRTTLRAVQPVSDMTSELGTQVARILHPTPTILPDPITIINQIRPLARLETIQYTVDNDKSYVYDRETGLLTHGDINLETTARQAAEDQIRQAALDDGILDQAQANAVIFLESLLNNLGYPQVSFTFPEK